MPNKALRIFGAVVFLLVLGLGWKYPLLAYCMFFNVAGGLFLAFSKGGRSGCGTLCPRGMFYGLLPDTRRALPAVLRRKPFGLFVPFLMLALIAVLRPASFSAWGLVFYWMIAATTFIGLVGMCFFNRFFWCSICPMGRLYRAIGAKKNRLHIAETCVSCGLCRKSCPFALDIPGAKPDGVLNDADCIRCGRCVAACPKKALRLAD